MTRRLTALLVQAQSESFDTLRRRLEAQAFQTVHAQNCREAKPILAGTHPPHLVFTDETLPDGTWADVTALVTKARVPVNVIVVGRAVDTRFYIEVIEAGAFDFVVPPFETADLTHVTRVAADNVIARREAKARTESSPQRALFSTLLPWTQRAQ